ncbi:BamA/TamA family outer membrane protein [candidate division KSB1 bacterium]|nr:BamA/TamA family outer membrane protein [candidate division KSB1 bacterium]
MRRVNKSIFFVTIGVCCRCMSVAAASEEDSLHAMIKGEIAQTKRTRIVAYPYAYYTPETELAIGGGGIMTFYTGAEKILRPSKLLLSAYYSIRDQYKFTLAAQMYLARNSAFCGLNLNYGQYAEKFWGIGQDTPDIETEDYISHTWGLGLDFQFVPLLEFIKADKSGVIYDYMANDIVDKKENPFLNNGEVHGSEGGISSGLGYILVKDSRDNIFFPNRGGFSRIRLIFYRQAIGSDYNFNYYEIDVRRYVAFKPDQVVAVQVIVNSVTGHPPFYELPMLGGSQMMRGYYQGRYRDENVFAGQVEYRAFFWKRLGFVVFAGLGDAAEKFSYFRLREAKVSGGGGLRFKFNPAEKVNLRMDVGFGKETSGVYFGLEEAF